MSTVKTDFPYTNEDRRSSEVEVGTTTTTTGFVYCTVHSGGGPSAATHFSPKRARKLARKLLKAAAKAERQAATL